MYEDSETGEFPLVRYIPKPGPWFVGIYGSRDTTNFNISAVITPATVCSEFTLLTANNGTFTDGAGAQYYNNSLICEWIIHRPRQHRRLPFTLQHLMLNMQRTANTIAYVVLSSSSQSTLIYCFVCVQLRMYNGLTVIDPLIGAYSGETLPDPVLMSGDTLLVAFSTDSSGQRHGFRAGYVAYPDGTSHTFTMTHIS